MLETVGRLLSAALMAALVAQSQNTKKVDTFFAGTVTQITDDAVVISRTVQKKTEQRTFQLTKDTKIEGKLRTRVRVTVRYTASEDGYIATMIVVRPTPPAKKK